MKSAILLLATASLALANTAPTVVIQSAAMRPGTTLMDVVYRVNDPDDTTVKTRALAFVDGVRSFAKVIKPVTFVEGTASKLGDAIPANVDHTLTWDVGADWDIDLGQIKFEVLAMDARGLLPFDWITIPAAGGNPALTISKDTSSDASVLDALFWQFAIGDPGLKLTNGLLSGSASSGTFSGISLANGTSPRAYGMPYLFKKMNLDPADPSQVSYATITARTGLLNTGDWHATNRSYAGIAVVLGWGSNFLSTIPSGLAGVSSIAAGGSHSLALKNNGTVVGWGDDYTIVPTGLVGVTAISAGYGHCLALKNDGTVAAWGGQNSEGETTIPTALSGVTAIAAGYYHSLALKNNGTVVAWGSNNYNQTSIPVGLSGVTTISAGGYHSLALKNDGTVVSWGAENTSWGLDAVPVGLTGVIAIAAGGQHSLALKNNGTVVAWGANGYGQTTIPTGLSGVTAIAAGFLHSLALKSDGTVVAWGYNAQGQTNVPAGLGRVAAISAGHYHNLAITVKAP